MRRRGSLNLASKAFSNERPLRRAAVVLSLVALVLLGVNGFLYGRYQAASVEVRSQLREVESGIEQELGAVQELEASLSSLDLEAQNEQVAFLNDRIAERTFPWSQLFDHLTEVLPSEVRLSSLNPTSESRGRGRRRGFGDGSVRLAMSGEAKTDEALFAFVDGLFSHPSFTDPHLVQESRETGTVHFLVDARYLPRAPGAPGTSAPEVAEAEPVAAPGEPAPPAPGGEAHPLPSAESAVAGPAVARGEEPLASAMEPLGGDGSEPRPGRPAAPNSGGTVAAPRSSATARPPAVPGGAPGTTPVGGRPRTGRSPVPEIQAPSNASAPPRLRGGG